MSLQADLELARRAARAAGELLLERLGRPASGVERKSTRTDMVSDADRDAEALIGALLTDERPDDGLVAEEGARTEGAGDRRWVVDPLDGTTNFLYAFPAWGVSVALEDARGAAVGVVYDPVRDELFSAVRGLGAWLDDEPIEVNRPQRLSASLIATGFGYDAERRRAQAERLVGVIGRVRDIRRAGAASLDLCWVAAGRLDGYYERGLQPWDWAAGSLIVTEAGGALRELEGDPAGLLAASPLIADELLALVA
ncbi:MAG: inositol monophosphatase family protein [Thermoleophilaceae bacterium]